MVWHKVIKRAEFCKRVLKNGGAQQRCIKVRSGVLIKRGGDKIHVRFVFRNWQEYKLSG